MSPGLRPAELRTTAPSGLRTVEFHNAYGRMVYRVVQEMNGTTISKRWVTHSLYYADASGGDPDPNYEYRAGKVKEARSPSACTSYTFTDSSGWTTGPA